MCVCVHGTRHTAHTHTSTHIQMIYTIFNVNRYTRNEIYYEWNTNTHSAHRNSVSLINSVSFSLIECLHSTPKYDIMLITNCAVCARWSVSYTDAGTHIYATEYQQSTNDLCRGCSEYRKIIKYRIPNTSSCGYIDQYTNSLIHGMAMIG